MANELEKSGDGKITEFNPERHRLKIAALNYGIEEAKRIKDWPKLEEAIDAKIEEQRKFVAWWEGNVTAGHGKGREQVPGSRHLSFRDAEELTGMKHQRVSDLGKCLLAVDKYREHLLGAEFRAAMLDDKGAGPRALGTGEDERYTPAKYVELARSVLGEIDLDPASCKAAQETVRAKKYFTKEEDALKREWHGRVWLNPPYSNPLIGQFIDKLIEELSNDNVSRAILLTHNCTDTLWFHKAAEVASAICFTRGRIDFSGGGGAPTCGQAFFYFGDEFSKFSEKFVEIGLVATPYNGK